MQREVLILIQIDRMKISRTVYFMNAYVIFNTATKTVQSHALGVPNKLLKCSNSSQKVEKCKEQKQKSKENKQRIRYGILKHSNSVVAKCF